jgi:hypothetical protein
LFFITINYKIIMRLGGLVMHRNNTKVIKIGDRVIGKYDLSGGIIEGTLKDNVLTGVWYQLVGSADCTYGPARLEFTENAFMGEWGYCKDPTPKGFWMGNRK